MKILLVVPISNYPFVHPSFLSNTDFPVGFAYIAAALKQAGHTVVGLNPNNDTRFGSAEELLKARLMHALVESNPQLVGLGGLSTDIHFVSDAIKLIRSVRPHVQIICGGGLITNDAEYVFNLLHPDFCIVGDGEHAIVQLADMLERGDTSFHTIPNLGHWVDGVAVFNERRIFQDIDAYPFPDYEPFDISSMLHNHSLVARYQYRYTRPHPVPMTLVAARGCPFNCSFCVNGAAKKYRLRTIANIMDEISVMYEKYHFNVLIILDELFAVHKERLQQFTEALLRNQERFGWNFDWSFQTHASANLDYETLQSAKRAGCYYFSYGIESASPTVLASMNKKTVPEQIQAAIILAEQVKIGFGGNFIFGDPAETVQTVWESLEFYKNHCIPWHVNIGLVQPYPGSALFDYCLTQGIIPDKLEYYDTINHATYNMTRLSDEEWQQLVSEAWGCINRCGVPATQTSSARKDLRAAAGEQSGNGVKIPWELVFSCPHCSISIYTRTLLHDEDVVNGKAQLVTGCPVCHKRFIVCISNNTSAYQLTGAEILS